ncbi:AraC family transcriptional regulator [Virgisporangium aliadipatigenens]|uniref:AraC family transcriptional regulator n=1 Tax=Virgisporangium aliadipatigenens TaxID=741659 RepID=A0A8J4DML8_9ACTN|nr:AraC family transcriptional regulator [Virgisporangium aliadipatigenens]GIJ43524.1 AraC family transcriptional regulator [Virgisporangium aliadipatigenens]
MTADLFTFPSATGAILADLGVAPGPVLRTAGLPEDLFRNAQVTLTAAQFYRVFTALEEATGDPALGATMARLMTAETFQTPLFAALCSPDLTHAAARIATYKRLAGPQKLTVTTGGDGLSVTTEMPPAPEPPAGLVAYELAFWVALARLGTRARVVPARATMPAPPAADGYRAYLGIPIEPGPSVTVTFTAHDARLPFLTVNAAMWQVFEADLRRRLADLDRVESTADRVRAALLELLPAGQGTAAHVARRLALSSRTLQRRLAREGTTFQAVLERTRLRLARHYLSRPEITVGEIAFLLGYDEPSSFYRAFHQWSGTTPQQARHLNGEAGRPTRSG